MQFAQRYSPRLLQILKRCNEELEWDIDYIALHSCIIEAMCDLDMDVFVPTPGVVSRSKASLRLYAKHGGNSEEVAHFKMRGTTFSGHPTLTTLGNTLRTIMYTKFAAFMSGIKLVCMVAGDDCVAFVHKDDAAPLQTAFETFVASPDKLAKTHGLG